MLIVGITGDAEVDLGEEPEAAEGEGAEGAEGDAAEGDAAAESSDSE